MKMYKKGVVPTPTPPYLDNKAVIVSESLCASMHHDMSFLFIES